MVSRSLPFLGWRFLKTEVFLPLPPSSVVTKNTIFSKLIRTPLTLRIYLRIVQIHELSAEYSKIFWYFKDSNFLHKIPYTNPLTCINLWKIVNRYFSRGIIPTNYTLHTVSMRLSRYLLRPMTGKITNHTFE